MDQFLFKPTDYNAWSQGAIDKITKTIESCETPEHLDSAKRMIDNFIIIMAIGDDNDIEETHLLARQMWLSYKLKHQQILSND